MPRLHFHDEANECVEPLIVMDNAIKCVYARLVCFCHAGAALHPLPALISSRLRLPPLLPLLHLLQLSCMVCPPASSIRVRLVRSPVSILLRFPPRCSPVPLDTSRLCDLCAAWRSAAP